jgi:sulfur carrier protein
MTTLNLLINQKPHQLPVGATVADAAALLGLRMPFAAAVNLQFVPRSQHAQHVLQDQDKVELITPVTGG